MDPSETYAEQILSRFDTVIEQAAMTSVQKRLGWKYVGNSGPMVKDRGPDDKRVYPEQNDSQDLKDARQAGIEIVLGYAGIRCEEYPHQFGMLAKLEERFGDNEAALRRVLRASLIQDINQKMARAYKRLFESRHPTHSIHNYDEQGNEGEDLDSLAIDAPDPNVNVEREVIESTKGAPVRKLSARFPLLWMREVEGFTNEIIAEKMNVSLATIKRRIQLEKIQGQKDPGNTPTSLARGEDVSQDAPLDLGELKRCDVMRNGKGPKRGHCKWCTRAIRDAAETEDGLYARMFTNPGGMSGWVTGEQAWTPGIYLANENARWCPKKGKSDCDDYDLAA